ncbi:MAG: 2-isopropylmalate synthase [Thermodesulfobacteriota bacterium]|nr:2-isopropylmalate synthase [Thermodesulfobacteriota bacterium]
MEKIRIFDTTLRDGEQSPGFSMHVSEKIRMAKQLENLRVDTIEAGYPIASKGDFEAVKTIAENIKRCQVAALARTSNDDIKRAWEAVKNGKSPRIHTFISTSDLHLKHQLRKSKEEVLDMAVKAVKQAKSYVEDVEFSAMDATRSSREYLAQIFEAVIDAGAVSINVPDTVGYTLPNEFGDLIRYLKENVPNINKAIISVHCHNDLGLAVANSYSAVINGARQVECTINGIGERAGNTSLEEIVMILRTRKKLLKLDTGVAAHNLYPSSRLLTSITGIGVQPNKAIVGANAFAHESGIHQDGVLKEKTTYEIITPESIGLPKNKLVLGKHSGRHAFKERLNNLGYDLSEEDLNYAFNFFKALADKKKEIYDEDIKAIITDVIITSDLEKQRYKLINLNVVSGSVSIPTATIVLEINGKKIRKAGFGDGPVDAAFKTIASMIKTRSKLLEYKVNAITEGTDAQGEVSVKIGEKGIEIIGHGADTDIIIASAKAYINALNKLEYLKDTSLKG